MSTDALREEHESLQRAVAASRRQFAVSSDSAFVREMKKAIEDYLELRARGMSREDGIKGLEAVLREMWPNKPSKFAPECAACDDTGWREMTCWAEQRCSRTRCQEVHPAHEHRYVVPCDCSRGDKRAGRNMDTPDAIAEAMRVRKPKPRGWSAVGR